MLGALAACATTPVDPASALAMAEVHMEKGEPVPALELLKAVEADDYTGDDAARYLVRKALAHAQCGELWNAFDTIRDFGDDHAFSPYAGQVQNLEFKLGSSLIQSERGFWIFTSDAEDGRIVLEHFMIHYPEHPAMPDALRLLGEQAYAAGDFALARDRFRELALQHETSEWFLLARYRIAMSWFYSLEGPDYDLSSMERTLNELRGFLGSNPENPQFNAEATTAFATVKEWVGRKHLIIADFYREIGQPRGKIVHWQMAAERFPETSASQEARAMLAAAAAGPGGATQ